jgi:kynurenine formamidase
MVRWMSVCVAVLCAAVWCVTLLCVGGCNPPAATPPATPPVVAKNPLVGKMIDLTHAYGSDTLYWPTDEKGFQLELGNNGRTPKGYYYAANRFSTAEHGGTHLDAPIHFAEAKPTSADVPLEKLVGEGAVVDVASACAQDPDYQVSIADLRAWEERNKRQLVDVIVLLRTGWSKRWPDRERYLGTAHRGIEALGELRFPGLAPDAARWLVEQRAVKAIGIDTASIDYGRSRQFETHVTLCGHETPIFENVTDLDALPEQGAWVVALPMKITGGSGGPLRIAAFLTQ